jgi:hypothetical protein
METLTFSIVLGEEDGKAFRLAPCDVGQISPVMWEQLSGDMAAEPTLTPYPVSKLVRRCQKGYAALAIHDGRIISYIALVPIVHPAPGAPSWETLTSGLDLHGATRRRPASLGLLRAGLRRHGGGAGSVRPCGHR